MGGQIVSFCEHDRKAASREIAGDPGAVDTPADNEHVTRQVC
jgi:hypothetical protein